MAHERRGHSALAEEFLLKRENHGKLIDRREATDTLRSPRPHLRRDVVQHRNTGGRGGSGCNPAAPVTTTSPSPRTARRKLSSSNLRGSASGASSRTCSTISSMRVAPNPCHPDLSR